MTPTPEEVIEAKYESYKRGWQVGSQGLPPTAAVGTPEPDDVQELNQGYKDGQQSYASAMDFAWRRFHYLLGVRIPKE